MLEDEYVDEPAVQAGPGIVVEEIEAGTIRVSLAPEVLDALTRLPAILSALDGGPAQWES